MCIYKHGFYILELNWCLGSHKWRKIAFGVGAFGPWIWNWKSWHDILGEYNMLTKGYLGLPSYIINFSPFLELPLAVIQLTLQIGKLRLAELLQGLSQDCPGENKKLRVKCKLILNFLHRVINLIIKKSQIKQYLKV